ncbi:MAG TPA: cell division protein FtsW [Cytophagales bacterium]|jgi:cell division protein FtsW|nr:cell division protein FtsW [Cytophagales bacterium]
MAETVSHHNVLKERFERVFKGDPVIWFVVFALAIFSILTVYSAAGTLAFKKHHGNTEYFLAKQLIFVIVSLFVMWLAHLVDYRYYSKISRFALILSVPFLLYSFFFGSTINDASRWLTIPLINQTFQPSDLAKFALITNLAAMLAKNQSDIEDIKKTLIPILLWSGAVCGLIALSNMSTAIMMAATCFLLMFIGRVPFKYLGMLFLVVVLAFSLALAFGQRWKTFYNRLASFTQTEIPFQLEQSYIAISTGGITGKGPGNSTQRNFLPHPYSDFIFAIVVEEYGLLGGVTVIGLYLLLLYRGMLTVANSQRAFGGLLSAGLSFLIVIQAMINMGVAVGLGPITGLPLPLLSMGGTSLLFTGVSIGIILSVSRGEGAEEN